MILDELELGIKVWPITRAIVPGKYAFVILCESEAILDEIQGYFADGSGEQDLASTLGLEIEDIRTSEGAYIGINVLGKVEDENNDNG